MHKQYTETQDNTKKHTNYTQKQYIETNKQYAETHKQYRGTLEYTETHEQYTQTHKRYTETHKQYTEVQNNTQKQYTVNHYSADKKIPVEELRPMWVDLIFKITDYHVLECLLSCSLLLLAVSRPTVIIRLKLPDSELQHFVCLLVNVNPFQGIYGGIGVALVNHHYKCIQLTLRVYCCLMHNHDKLKN